MPSPLKPLYAFLFAQAALTVSCTCQAYTVTGSWPSGDRNFVFELDGRDLTPALPAGGLSDGTATWTDLGLEALAHWNAHMVRTHLTGTTSTGSPIKKNGVNEVAFANDIYGEAFGDRVLGSTLRSYASAPTKVRIAETDIFINASAAWDSYRGPLRTGATDLRRVLIHELGHGVGLNHVDEGATASVARAIMETYVSEIDDLTEDDIAAAEVLYSKPITTPVITRQPLDQTVQVGERALMDVVLDSGTPEPSSPTRRYAWLFTPNGEALEWLFNQLEAPLPLGAAQTYDSGVYRLRIETPDSTVESEAATLQVNPVAEDPQTHLYNLSTRGFVDNGFDSLIMGFVVAGSENRRVLIRAAGPTLAAFGITNPLEDPVLEVHTTNGAGQDVIVASNDNWQDVPSANLGTVFTDAGAFAFVDGSSDAAVVVTLPPGNYTAVVHAKDNTAAGIALSEVYDLTTSTSESNRLTNLSTRGHVYPGVAKMIGGLSVQGTGPRTYLIRAAGATLKVFGITTPLDDPTLGLYNSESRLERYTNDWDNPFFLQALINQITSQVGAFPLGDRTESVMLLTLNPGNYSFQVEGGHGEDGVSLIEVYEVPASAPQG